MFLSFKKAKIENNQLDKKTPDKEPGYRRY